MAAYFRSIAIHGHVTRRDWIRFMQKVFMTSDGHWLWRAGKDKDGYGKFKWHGHTVRSHCFAYRTPRGDFSLTYEIDHLCGIVSCVNPDCLEPVLHIENLLRGSTAARNNRAKTHCPQGHEYTLNNTYYKTVNNHRTHWRPMIYRVCRTCGRERVMKRYKEQKR